MSNSTAAFRIVQRHDQYWVEQHQSGEWIFASFPTKSLTEAEARLQHCVEKAAAKDKIIAEYTRGGRKLLS